ncbi:MAG: SDR family NAD(P)-dependent oxidoreductase [Anaerolineales bacterium]|nr:SDR family NAD(P)-dependent oxidoreductase [Anaerolineales bacterium]
MTGTILITGCSSGFGRATALHLAQRGWRVLAVVRKVADAENLRAEALQKNITLEPLVCAITDDAQVAELGRTVAMLSPTLDALLNNAGTAYPGPLEILPLADLRAQLEINVVAQVAVTQALLPLLKAARGTILNVSSMGGRMAFPVTGAYHASKFALEALSDSLRLELAPFGVKVVVIEPGGSPTAIWKAGEQNARALYTGGRAEAYRGLIARYAQLAEATAREGFPPEQFAALVERILMTPHPRARYSFPFRTTLNILLRRFLPDAVWDRVMRRLFRW